MPQLDIVYIFTNYIWTWLILISLTWKIQTVLLSSGPEQDIPLEDLEAELAWILPWM
uniref:ATP synthase F0 subunit 8 n=1 Tax=Xenopeltis hainanensis TaxID=2483472 RepID=A0A8H2S715_9SAUR|nr:ATP synthase F0 subunit 8 [Xenopeltis hainanensis]